jgi:hypothetical protein
LQNFTTFFIFVCGGLSHLGVTFLADIFFLIARFSFLIFDFWFSICENEKSNLQLFSHQGKRRTKKMQSWVIIGVVVGVLVLLLVGLGVGIYLMFKKGSGPNPPACGALWPPTGADLRDNTRLWGTAAGGGAGGVPAVSPEQCYQYCACSPGVSSQGFAFWKDGGKCWCAKSPYNIPGHPKWETDSQWFSGIFSQ